MKKFGMKASQFDPCIYHRNHGEKKLIVAVYVDDFLIFSNDEQGKNDLKKMLCEQFKMKDLGVAK
jgi:hypothetical protein